MLCGTILLVTHLLKNIGDKIFAWPWGHYKLAYEPRVNRNTCGRANSISIRIRADVETFESAKKNLRIQKYPDAFERGLSHRVDGPIPKLFTSIRIQRGDLLFAFIILGLQTRNRWLFSGQKNTVWNQKLAYLKVMQALDFVSRLHKCLE